MLSPAPHTIDVVSDATGDTAERVIRAAMLQFPQSNPQIRLHANVRTRTAASPILNRAAADHALVVFSVVSPDLSRYIHRITAELHIEAIDVIGTVIGKLGSFLDQPPLNRPGPMLPLSEEYFRRMAALDFAVKNDAGRNPQSFVEADLILVGVSRTSKTPLSTLLAQRGLKVANLTLALGVQPPAELDAAPQDRVVGLTIDIDRLCEMRQARLRQLGMPEDARYAVRAHVKQELDFAGRLFDAHPGWPVVDVTGRAVEETTSIILESMKHRLGQRPIAQR